MSDPASPTVTRWTPLGLALVAMFAAAWRAVEGGGPDWLAGAAWTAGVLMLGTWIERERGG